ncbi:MAG: UDP-N-acetylmuramate dehydrogenase [Candidatus Paceibacterota bacterium]|jgi:UDP-N-acetylmuramate dehydrogenase|nr:UDP-N-acetylmuramate dehydrogenase [Candidatus Paceibacterota bacterium]
MSIKKTSKISRTAAFKCEENISLKDFTTFRTGGAARYFVRVKNVEDLKSALRFANKNKLPFFILGRGANVLVSDDGFFGVVIKMEIGGIQFINNRVIAGSGEDWDPFVAATVEHGLIGLENLSLIPGTVGASACGNIGAYGVEAKDLIFSVEALNTETMRMKKFSNKACAFGYRESFFKKAEGKKYIITKVSFDLGKKKLKTDYKDVQEYFERKKIMEPTSKDLRNAIIEIRRQKLPSAAEVGTAGSFFKNPVVSKRKAEALKKEFPELPIYMSGDGTAKLSAGYLLDKICGFKGYKKGNIGTWEKQALVIVNRGNSTTKEILQFAEEMKKTVKEKTGIELEREVQVIEN